MPEKPTYEALEHALQESDARFKALHNASFGGIVIHDRGIILDFNQGLVEMSGYCEAELYGMDGMQLIAERSRGLVMKNIRSGYQQPYEGVGLRKNGEEFPMRLEARVIPYKGKKVRAVEFRDITEQKKAEAEQECLKIELIQAQKMESIGRLAGGVAHDFNNMLSIILGNTEIILEDMDPSNPLTANLKEIYRAAERSADLTRQLLAFARKQTIDPRVIDLNTVLAEMLKMLQRLIGEDISLAWLPGKGTWRVNIDPTQVDQILANLCINARDAIRGVGKITIETSNTSFDDTYCQKHINFNPGDYVMLAVSDNGSGMDQKIMGSLFEPFFTTKHTGQGSGLGLATVYGIARQNNGFINVYSEPNVGSTFKIYLPRHEEILPGRQKKEYTDSCPGGNETILLVEDEKPILRMAQMMLERMGYTVLATHSPNEAVRIIEQSSHGKIHLLMTDVIMPEMNGQELSKRLITLQPDLKCLFMSGYTANVIAHHGVLDKGVMFINKPFSRQELAVKLRRMLDQGPSTRANGSKDG